MLLGVKIARIGKNSNRACVFGLLTNLYFLIILAKVNLVSKSPNLIQIQFLGPISNDK